jgi:hypothetical protein
MQLICLAVRFPEVSPVLALRRIHGEFNSTFFKPKKLFYVQPPFSVLAKSDQQKFGPGKFVGAVGNCLDATHKTIADRQRRIDRHAQHRGLSRCFQSRLSRLAAAAGQPPPKILKSAEADLQPSPTIYRLNGFFLRK